MSGHSKWHNIRVKKEAEDAKRSKIFSKLARMITIAAREGGNPETNTKLRTAIEQAKNFNMPSENIEKAIKRGTGELKGGALEEFLFEAYGPENSAILIEGITDNMKRALTEIKQVLTESNAKLAESGSVKWMFTRKGVIIVDILKQDEKYKNKENIELEVIECGADDIDYAEENVLSVYTKTEDLNKVKNCLEGKGIKIESASLDWIPNTTIEISDKAKEALKNLFEKLDNLDDVQELYCNVNL